MNFNKHPSMMDDNEKIAYIKELERVASEALSNLTKLKFQLDRKEVRIQELELAVKIIDELRSRS